jgi:hypothetical protein
MSLSWLSFADKPPSNPSKWTSITADTLRPGENWLRDNHRRGNGPKSDSLVMDEIVSLIGNLM